MVLGSAEADEPEIEIFREGLSTFLVFLSFLQQDLAPEMPDALSFESLTQLPMVLLFPVDSF